jgi:hypothetical protein
MDKKTGKLAEKRLKEGWIKSAMIIEVLAISKDAARSALEKHVEKMGDEDAAFILEKRFQQAKAVENPTPRIKKAYSLIVDVDLLARNFDGLVSLVVAYAPSSVEILEPEKITIDMGEAQGILNSMSEIIHRFAQAGLGGVMVSS